MSGAAKARSIDEDRMSMISRMSQAVTTNISKADMVEMKSFCKPPQAVKDTLEATTILLGKTDTSWTAIKKYMGAVGEQSLLQQIADRDPECITAQQRKKANVLLAPYSPEKIRSVSAATTTIFEWAKAVAEE